MRLCHLPKCHIASAAALLVSVGRRLILEFQLPLTGQFLPAHSRSEETMVSVHFPQENELTPLLQS
jgi:hypothetical protein